MIRLKMAKYINGIYGINYTGDLLRMVLLEKWLIVSLKFNTPLIIFMSENQWKERRTSTTIILSAFIYFMSILEFKSSIYVIFLQTETFF